jgi:hypothetical protein
MSQDSSTEQPAGLSDQSRKLNINVSIDKAEEILQLFGLPVPNAADLDEICIRILPS